MVQKLAIKEIRKELIDQYLITIAESYNLPRPPLSQHDDKGKSQVLGLPEDHFPPPKPLQNTTEKGPISGSPPLTAMSLSPLLKLPNVPHNDDLERRFEALKRR